VHRGVPDARSLYARSQGGRDVERPRVPGWELGATHGLILRRATGANPAIAPTARSGRRRGARRFSPVMTPPWRGRVAAPAQDANQPTKEGAPMKRTPLRRRAPAARPQATTAHRGVAANRIDRSECGAARRRSRPAVHRVRRRAPRRCCAPARSTTALRVGAPGVTAAAHCQRPGAQVERPMATRQAGLSGPSRCLGDQQPECSCGLIAEVTLA
jgi:hypothetical protein